jgi:DedD protein
MGNIDVPADQNVDLKKSARRRLVGAIALALFAIVVLPMVMEREPKPPSQDIQVRIPGQESPLPALEASVGVKSSTQQSISPAVQQVVSQPSVSTATAILGSNIPEMHVASPVLKNTPPVDKAVGAGKTVPEKLIAAKEKEANAASTSLNGNTEQWLVRLGAYQNAGNVRVLLNKTKEMGFPSYSEKIDSAAGLRIRVFAGPFSSRESAEKAQSKIKKIGVDGTVVAKP